MDREHAGGFWGETVSDDKIRCLVCAGDLPCPMHANDEVDFARAEIESLKEQSKLDQAGMANNHEWAKMAEFEMKEAKFELKQSQEENAKLQARLDEAEKKALMWGEHARESQKAARKIEAKLVKTEAESYSDGISNACTIWKGKVEKLQARVDEAEKRLKNLEGSLMSGQDLLEWVVKADSKALDSLGDSALTELARVDKKYRSSQKDVAVLRIELQKREWGSYGMSDLYCASCKRWEGNGHKMDCGFRKALESTTTTDNADRLREAIQVALRDEREIVLNTFTDPGDNCDCSLPEEDGLGNTCDWHSYEAHVLGSRIEEEPDQPHQTDGKK